MKKTRTEYSLLNMVTGVGGYVVNTILGFVCRMVFARCLSESYLGMSSLISNLLGMLSLAELGIGSAIVYALYKPLKENDEKKIASLMRVYRNAYYIIGIVVAVVGIALIPFLKYIVGDTSAIKESIYFIYGIYLFNTVSSYFFSFKSSLLTASQRNFAVIGTSYLITSLQSVIQIVLLLVVDSYLPYLIVQTIGTQLFNIIISIITNRVFPCIKQKKVAPLQPNEKKRLFKDVKRVTVYKLSGVLVNSTDNLVITYFSGLGITGLASNYSLLSSTLNTLISQLFGSLTASVGNYNVEKDEESQYSFFKSLNLSNFWLYSWGAIGIAFVSSDLVRLIFGENYIMEFKIPLIIALNFYMFGMQNAILTFKNTRGLFKYGQYLLLLTAAINIVGDIVLGKYLGVFGIYLATLIARAVTNAWYEPYAIMKYAFHKSPMIYFGKYLLFAVLLFVEGAICYFVCKFIDFNVVVNIILKVILCTIVPNTVLFIVFRKSEEFNYIRKIINNVIRIVNNLFGKLLKRRK